MIAAPQAVFRRIPFLCVPIAFFWFSRMVIPIVDRGRMTASNAMVIIIIVTGFAILAGINGAASAMRIAIITKIRLCVAFGLIGSFL